ncbi:helicase-related protein, partial [Rheinheimera pleomorphica]|uniref:helicase-related protein n=1 Tax=Rheinheimera pleomorphica TaxID=2703963 RepID=UPI002B243794
MHLADDAQHKLELLIHLLKQDDVSKAIVFVKTRERLASLTGQLETAGLRCGWLHGEMPQEQRMQAVERFSSGR